MRVLLIAPDTTVAGSEDTRHFTMLTKLNTVPEIRLISAMHRTTLLHGIVTSQDVYTACRGSIYDIVHFATHGDENSLVLANDELLDAEDVAQLCRLAHVRAVFINACKSARIANFVTHHGIPYAIATTIDIPDRDAWKTALSFYESCREQVAKLHDPALVDIPLAVKQAINGDPSYMLLVAPLRLTEMGGLITDFEHWKAAQTLDTANWRASQRRLSQYLIIQSTIMWLFLTGAGILLWRMSIDIAKHIMEYPPPLNW